MFQYVNMSILHLRIRIFLVLHLVSNVLPTHLQLLDLGRMEGHF